jgi:subtilisin-like proprotein convertase family protein
LNASATLTVESSRSVAITKSFRNRQSITIRDHNVATAYPSAIAVAGMSGNITRVSVTLNRLTHSRPSDLNVLLVGPGGQQVVLMTGAGGTEDLERTTIGFMDTAAARLPLRGQIKTGSYKPTSYDQSYRFPSPAPAGPYATALSAFNNTAANGAWKLYIMDDTTGASGYLAEGWSLNITTTGQ